MCLAFVFIMVGATSLSACKSSPSTASPEVRAQTKELFPDKPPKAGETHGQALSESAPELAGKWTIVLLRLKGEGQDAATQSVLRTVRASGVPEAFLETRTDSTLVVAGKFDSPTSRDAQAMLKRIKEIEVDGQRPYMAAHMLPPPPVAMKGSIPEWDLRNARTKYGKQAEYTLQINIYTNPTGRATPSELTEFQKAAEQAVQTLRKDGVDAFYYHDQTGSTVTVGLFSQAELDGGQSLKPGSDRSLRDLQQKFPNGLVNGAGVRDRTVDSTGKPVESLRPSFIVRVPD